MKTFNLKAFKSIQIIGTNSLKNGVKVKAALKAVEYKEETPNKMHLNRFIDSLKEMGDQETLDLLK